LEYFVNFTCNQNFGSDAISSYYQICTVIVGDASLYVCSQQLNP